MPTRGNAPARRDEMPTQATGVSLAPRQGDMTHATAVEATRAMAEVQAAVVLAKQFPRSITKAIEDRDALCARKRMAEKSSYRYSRGGSQITGPSIHLARALAGVWGNITYGLVEIERKPSQKTSTMLAFAWDLETNTRPTTTFEVPWVRSAGGALVPLIDPRDVYENNANQGSRRVREMLFAVMPDWFVDEAVDACNATLERTEQEKPIRQRRTEMVGAFRDRFGVTGPQLEAKLDRKVDEMTPPDLAALGVIYRTLERNETTVAAEFPPPERERIRVDELATAPPPPAAPPEAERAAVARRRATRQPRQEPPAGEAEGLLNPALHEAQPPVDRWDDPLPPPDEPPPPEPGTAEFELMDAPRQQAARSRGGARPDVGRLVEAFGFWDVAQGPEGEAIRLEAARRFLDAPELFALTDLTPEDAERLAEHVESMSPEEARDLGLPAT
jgi:hypothetical protein